MAQAAIREYDAKVLLESWLARCAPELGRPPAQVAAVDRTTDLRSLADRHPWLLDRRLVVKVDQLVKRRGRHGLLALDVDWATAARWIADRSGTEVVVDGRPGTLERFLVEPLHPHADGEERYVCLRMARAGDELLICDRGGVDVGDVETAACRVLLPLGGSAPAVAAAAAHHLGLADDRRTARAAAFLASLVRAAEALHLAYVEVNPLVVGPDGVELLDLAVRVDDTATAATRPFLDPLELPAPFGRRDAAEEARVRALDAQSGASLKLTVLNPDGRLWLLVAGGGASIAFADTVCDLGQADELANYGEYSGDPSAPLTYEYASVVIGLMTRGAPDGRGKALLVGGGVANFTDVAATFEGIAGALRAHADRLRAHGVRLYVRRGGPNAEAGLRLMRALGDELGVPSVVCGADAGLTSIVPQAIVDLGLTGAGRG